MDMLDLEDVFPGTADAPLPDYGHVMISTTGDRIVIDERPVPVGQGTVEDHR